MLSSLDYAVIGSYFLLMAGIGWYFRRANGDTSDFFRGGGGVPWWLVGSSSFMSSFSAWTFTGAAGLAFDQGMVVLVIYWANSFAAFFAAIFLAAWFRQTRAITSIDAIRQRLGRTNQQVLVWLRIPLGLIVAAIWLYGLAIFLSPVFGISVAAVIILCGVVVIFIAATGGSWAVITGDFMQALLLMPVTLIAAWLALRLVGGVGALAEQLPPGHLKVAANGDSGFGGLWIFALLLQKIFAENSLGGIGRYLCVRDGREARWSAVLTGVLFLIGSGVWFIPPLAARAAGFDLATRFPQLAQPSEAAYAAMAMATMPAGLFGLLITGIMAATLSSMDSGLNANAGNFVRGVYRPLLRPNATEREFVLVSRVTTCVMGVIIILLALKYSMWRETGVFHLMFSVSAMLAIPTAVPLLLCLFVRRSPDWAVWSSMLLGLSISAALGWLPRLGWFQTWAEGVGLSEALQWLRINEIGVVTVANVVVCSAWYFATAWLNGKLSESRQREVHEFFVAMRRPVDSGERTDDRGIARIQAIALMCYCYGGYLALIALLGNTLLARAAVLFCAVFFVVSGLSLRMCGQAGSARTRIKPVLSK